MEIKRAFYQDGKLIIHRDPCDYCYNNKRCFDCLFHEKSNEIERGICVETFPRGVFPWPRDKELSGNE